MPGFTRRSFIKGGSAAIAAAVAAPAMPALLATAGADAPEAESEAAGIAQSSTGAAGPVIAQLKDLASGEISIYTGTQEIVYRDPEMAARLARAAAR
jgi:hypothetical protein